MTEDDETSMQAFESVWDALADTPGEALNLKLRSDLMDAIEAIVRGWGGTQAEAAKRLGVTQPRLNDLLRGRITRFSLDALTLLASRAGLEVGLRVRVPRRSGAKAKAA